MRPKDVYELDVEEFSMLWQAITVIEAREALVSLSISDFPHASKNSRSKLHRSMHRDAYPKFTESDNVSTEQLAKMLAGMGLNGR